MYQTTFQHDATAFYSFLRSRKIHLFVPLVVLLFQRISSYVHNQLLLLQGQDLSSLARKLLGHVPSLLDNGSCKPDGGGLGGNILSLP